MMRNVHLYGALRKYGKVLRLDIDKPIDAFRAIFANFPGSRDEVKAGHYKIMVGKRNIGEDELEFHCGKNDIYIYPVAKGAGGGAFKIVAGAVLVVIGAILSFTPAAAASQYFYVAGASLILGGAYELLAPTPKATNQYGERESPDSRPSFIYNGPVNTMEQGATIPVVYGKMRTGSVMASAGLTVGQI